MTKNNKYRLALLVFGILLFVVVDFFSGRDNSEKYQKFHHSVINGKIEALFRLKGGVAIIVKGVRFTFVPIYVNDKTEFQYFARVGDSVYKPSKTDSLKLIHDGKTYVYDCEKVK